MKRFINQIMLFFSLLGIILLLGLFVPVTPRSKNSMISYKIQKDSLLANVDSPRIVFIGGSNLVFGLNSQIVKDSFNVNPINAGLAINFGLVFMMDDVLPDIKSGDLVIVAPEYEHFYGRRAYGGGTDLFMLLMDVDRAGLNNLRLKHLPGIIKAYPNYFLSKFKIKNYFYNKENDVYGKQIFNEYGDSKFHWKLKRREFNPLNPIKNEFNYTVIEELEKFNKKIKDKGAILMITYPGCQDLSLTKIREQVDKIQMELEKTDILILGNPQSYSIPDSLMFDSPYHLSKKGVELRTNQLIRDLKRINELK